MHTPSIMLHRRSITGLKCPPATACQKLVTSDGAIRMAAACAGGMTMAKSPMDTVGRPRPMTPLTKPARTNTAAMKIQCGSSMGPC
jgi:hypothetical protein